MFSKLKKIWHLNRGSVSKFNEMWHPFFLHVEGLDLTMYKFTVHLLCDYDCIKKNNSLDEHK